MQNKTKKIHKLQQKSIHINPDGTAHYRQINKEKK
jgi:hypothetical protein